MDARFLIFVLSLSVAANGLSEDEVKESEEWANRLEDMRFCLNQENVTEEEMKAFLFEQREEDDNESLKMAVYCFVKRINFRKKELAAVTEKDRSRESEVLKTQRNLGNLRRKVNNEACEGEIEFDGVSWNMEVITESESKNPEMLKVINECLTKDDFTLPAHERAYQAQKCILERGRQ